jgi:hypothetical protein
MTPILTMYLADRSIAEDERLRFERVDTQPLSTWYARFAHLNTVRQNEALLGALIEAEERGTCSAEEDGCVYLFVKGDFPATDIGAPVCSGHADLNAAGDDTDEMSTHLSSRRIAYTPHRFHGYFIDGNGEVLDPGEVHIRYQASTIEAVAAMAEHEFEECENYFGDDIVRLASGSAFAQSSRS